jgi:hypothetical protein
MPGKPSTSVTLPVLSLQLFLLLPPWEDRTGRSWRALGIPWGGQVATEAAKQGVPAGQVSQMPRSDELSG